MTTHYGSKRTLALLTCKTLALSILTVSLGGNAVSAPKARHFSTVEENTVRLEPSGTSFQIPLAWTKDYGTVNSTHDQLEKVRAGKGEWDREYARVVNAALPFGNCSAEAGSHPWNGPSFGGVQMRAYVFEAGARGVDERIAAKGLAAAKSLPRKTVRNARLESSEVGHWHKTVIRYDVWYSDYGGTANVEFYETSNDQWRVVLVFMHVGTTEPSEGQRIVSSFSWK